MFNFSFLKTTELLDAPTRNWILDAAIWAIDICESEPFAQQQSLILPSNEFYPGRVSSVDEMTESIVRKTIAHAQMSHWPFQLLGQNSVQHNGNVQPPQKLIFNGLMRGKRAELDKTEVTQPIPIYCNFTQVNQPEDMIAATAQQLAYQLIVQRGTLPPGGKEFLEQGIDLLACFLGFGVMMANTAYQFKGGCGSCFNPHANRNAHLPEQETLYILALYCVIKGFDAKITARHLKGHLRSNFKIMYKQIAKKKAQQELHPLLLAS